MAYNKAHRRACCDAITALGARITLHSGDPGETGADRITGAGEGTTTWAAASDGPGGDEARSVGSTLSFTVPASTSATHYGVWSGDTFLRGHELNATLTTNANGSAEIEVTPSFIYTG